MPRYVLQHSYHGRQLHGWQRQPQARSVQGELERVLAILLRHEVALVGAGRTDTGVHASRTYCHLDTDRELPPDFLYRLNAILPADIAVEAVYRATDSALHARFSAISRSYVYTIARHKQPLIDDQAWLLTAPLDESLLNPAADALKLLTDFASFAKTGGNQHTTLCRIYESRWECSDGIWRYHVTANRFLRGMVRALVGTQVEIAAGRIRLDDLAEIAARQDRRLAGPTVPANGLCLTGVAYPPGKMELVQHL